MKTLPHQNRFLSSCFTAAALLLVMAGGLGFGIRHRAGAFTDKVKERILFEDFLVPNYCTGEIISETGAIYTRFQYVVKPGGGITLQYHYQFKATGIGDLGNEYNINQESRIKDIASPKVGDDFTFVDKFVQIGKGPDDNTAFFFTYRLVIEPDGMVRMFVVEVKFDCRG